MATENSLTSVTRVAGADLSSSQYFGVELSSGDVIVNSANGAVAYGVLQNEPESGEEATVAISGLTKATAGAAISQDADVAVDAGGKFITAATGDAIVGKALTAAGGDGEQFTLDFRSYLGDAA